MNIMNVMNIINNMNIINRLEQTGMGLNAARLWKMKKKNPLYMNVPIQYKYETRPQNSYLIILERNTLKNKIYN